MWNYLGIIREVVRASRGPVDVFYGCIIGNPPFKDSDKNFFHQ